MRLVSGGLPSGEEDSGEVEREERRNARFTRSRKGIVGELVSGFVGWGVIGAAQVDVEEWQIESGEVTGVVRLYLAQEETVVSKARYLPTVRLSVANGGTT